MSIAEPDTDTGLRIRCSIVDTGPVGVHMDEAFIVNFEIVLVVVVVWFRTAIRFLLVEVFQPFGIGRTFNCLIPS